MLCIVTFLSISNHLDMIKPKEKKLVNRVRQNKDAEAFTSLYCSFEKKVYRKILFRVPSKEEASDIQQEVFLKLWDYLTSNDREVENLTALIYKIAQNLIAAYYVNQNLAKTISDRDKIDLEEISWKVEDKKVDMEKEFDIKTRIEIVNRKISEVNNLEYEQVIRLRLIDELSHKEISKIIEKPEGHVRVILHRALKKLRKIIEESNEI